MGHAAWPRRSSSGRRWPCSTSACPGWTATSWPGSCASAGSWPAPSWWRSLVMASWPTGSVPSGPASTSTWSSRSTWPASGCWWASWSASSPVRTLASRARAKRGNPTTLASGLPVARMRNRLPKSHRIVPGVLRPPWLGTAVLAAALALSAACAHDPLAPGAANDWVTAQTPHFILHTDAGAGALQRTASRFEQTYAALAAMFRRGLAAPVEALVFGDDDEYTALNGNTAGRFIFGIGRTGSVLVARNSDDRERLERVLAHELAHRFVRETYPRVPNWLSEGIASFVETVEVRSNQVVFGGAPREASHVEWSPGGVSFAELTSVDVETLY